MNEESSHSYEYQQNRAGQNVNKDSRVNNMSGQMYHASVSGHHSYSYSSLNQLEQGSGPTFGSGASSHNMHPASNASSFYSGNQQSLASRQSSGSGQMPTTPFGTKFPPLTSPYMISHLNASGQDSFAGDTPSAYFMSPSYPLQAPRSVVKGRPDGMASDKRYHENSSKNESSELNQMKSNGQYTAVTNVSTANPTNSATGGKEELPRRVLQFEPSPSLNYPSFSGVGADSNQVSSTTPDKMDSLDESHRSVVEGYRHSTYDHNHAFQGQYDFYNPAGPSRNRIQGQYPIPSALQRMPGSSAKKTSFSPHISNAFDGMPFVDFHPNSDTKLDDLIISPAVGMSSRGGRASSIMR